MVGFCTDPNSTKSHSGWEGSDTYDCSDGRLFGSSVVGIPRDGSAGGSGLQASRPVIPLGLDSPAAVATSW